MSAPRSLPTLEIPVAFLRFWSAASDLAATVDELPPIEGVERLGQRLLAVRPVRGRGEVFDIAARLAGVLLVRHAHRTGETLPGILIYPGRLSLGPQGVAALDDTLSADLEAQPPRLPAGRILLTGYVAAWLGGRYAIDDVGVYEAPSGHRVPLIGLGAERSAPRPWHNPELLGRHPYAPRAQVDACLAEALVRTPCRVRGCLGVGKTRAVAAAIGRDAGLEIWIGLGRALPSLPLLARSLARDLSLHVPGAGIDPKLLGGADPEATARLLVRWLAIARERTGAAPWVVCDVAEGATEGDLRLLGLLLEQPDLGDACRWIVIDRTGGAESTGGADRTILDDRFDAESTVEIPPFDTDEMDALCGEVFHGLEIPEPVRQRLVTAAGGHPFALEEGLLGLVHRGLIRQVYGSFFFAGGDDVGFEPSRRLVRHVAAEVDRLGHGLALRVLAVADGPTTAEHLAAACARVGVEPAAGWHLAALDAGWLRGIGAPEPSHSTQLAFACPAYGAALAGTLSQEGVRALRHALGEVLAEVAQGEALDRNRARDTSPVASEAGWTAYRLMAGSPEALPTLLDFTRESSGNVPREEIFHALWDEYGEHRARWGDEATELEILWVLLPLARRLGCLGQLRRELDRGIELARGQETRYVALVALAAELAQEQGDFRAAESGLREALLASEGFAESRRATLFVRLGALLHREERWNEAQEIFSKLLSVVEVRAPTLIGATCRFFLGNIALQRRQLDAAEKLHLEATEIRRQQGSGRHLGTSLSALGAVSLARGDYPTALVRFEQALQALASSEPTEQSYALIGLGRAYGQLGDLAGAGRVLRQALDSRQGRDDRHGEAIARLELAANEIGFGHLAAALDETRRAHFHLSLIPEVSLLGDAERLLGRVLLRQGEAERAREHFGEAVRIHAKHEDTHGLLEDRSWLVEVSLRSGQWQAVREHALALEKLLEQVQYPANEEGLCFCLYKAFSWLEEHGFESRDPVVYLRRAYRELMRKTQFLEPVQRHNFLYQVHDHQAILNAAASAQISLPIFTVTPSG